MADEAPETPPDLEPGEDFLDEDVFIVVAEKVVLEMLRAVSLGADPDFVYTEFWANQAVQQVVCDECECCHCDSEDDDDCECECECESELDSSEELDED